MSTLVACPSCTVELEVPPEMSASIVNCPSCTVEFEIEVENPYQRPKSEIRRTPSSAGAPKFPTICKVMAIIIICLELLRLVIGALMCLALSSLEGHIILEEPGVKSVAYVAIAIMFSLAVLGMISSSLTLAKKSAGVLLSKIYVFFTLVGICFSFINFNIVSIIINGVIAVLLVISIINFSSWLRQTKEIEKLERKRSRGQQRRRPAGKLKRRSS